MDIEDILKEMGNPKMEISQSQIGIVALRSFQMACVNRHYLSTILKNQITIAELIKGKVSSDIDDDEIDKKFQEFENDIIEFGTKEYTELLQQIISND